MIRLGYLGCMALGVLFLWPASCQPPQQPADASVEKLADARPVKETPASPSCDFLKDGASSIPRPNYRQYDPNVGSHCMGTNYQQIEGVQKVVFLGDSITRGTPPTPELEYYRWTLFRKLEQKFGELEVQECSKWGAKIPDLLEGPDAQIPKCFAKASEPKKTLIVMTIGGNDMHAMAKLRLNEGVPFDGILKDMDARMAKLKKAIEWLKDPKRFPNGSYLLFANVYEFTDGRGDILSCPLSQFGGVDKPWPDMYKTYVEMNQRMLQLAVQTKTDMIFLFEHFCGHGLHHKDAGNACYRGPETARWFDPTCIHPNAAGHAEIAKMFFHVVQE